MVPKRIYSLWLQGMTQAPPLVQWGLRRWKTLHPDYELVVLEAAQVNDLLAGSSIPWKTMAPQALSDVVRSQLMAKHGGIWVDASVIAVRPLDTWLPELMPDTGFFAFRRPFWDRPLSSWFLASAPENYLAGCWWQEVQRFWQQERVLARYKGDLIPENPIATVAPTTQNQREYPYFWVHYLFEYLVVTNIEFRRQWNACSNCSAGPPHELQNLFAGRSRPGLNEMRSALLAAPVQKLNWRINYPIDKFDKIFATV